MSADEVKTTESLTSQPRERFENYIYDTFARKIQSWDAEIRTNIYAISFFIHDYEDDPHQPEVHLCYNTLNYWQERVARGRDPGEAKWNFALGRTITTRLSPLGVTESRDCLLTPRGSLYAVLGFLLKAWSTLK